MIRFYADEFGRLSDPIESLLSDDQAEKMIHELCVAESPLNLEEWSETWNYFENLSDQDLIEKYNWL
jgi:hypothetical protein